MGRGHTSICPDIVDHCQARQYHLLHLCCYRNRQHGRAVLKVLSPNGGCQPNAFSFYNVIYDLSDGILKYLGFYQCHSVLVAKQNKRVSRFDIIDLASVARNHYLSFFIHLQDSEDVFTILFLHNRNKSRKFITKMRFCNKKPNNLDKISLYMTMTCKEVAKSLENTLKLTVFRTFQTSHHSATRPL